MACSRSTSAPGFFEDPASSKPAKPGRELAEREGLGPYSCLGPNSPALSLRVATPVVRTPVQWRRRRQGASAALASAGEIFPAPVNKGVNAALPPLPVADPAGGEWAHAGAVTVPAATPSLPRALARRCGRRLRRRPVPCVSALAGADDGGCGGGAGASLLTCSLAHLLTCSLAHLLTCSLAIVRPWAIVTQLRQGCLAWNSRLALTAEITGICVQLARFTASSVLALRSISPRKGPAGCSGR
jgi:hypothetical protein